jgi:hypothetical protein
VKALRTFFNHFGGPSNRFNRYYGGILGTGAGYPTADEARRDMRRHDEMNTSSIGWLR